jgi:hypothetical protein
VDEQCAVEDHVVAGAEALGGGVDLGLALIPQRSRVMRHSEALGQAEREVEVLQRLRRRALE